MDDTIIYKTEEWLALKRHYDSTRDLNLRQLLAGDSGSNRVSDMYIEVGDLHFDYSRHLVTSETIDLLMALAERSGLHERVSAMFAGVHINTTEDRSVLHVALRMPATESLVVDGTDVVKQVHRVLDKMGKLSDDIRSGTWLGYTGKQIRNIINIGIGGSDLGPAMAYQALLDYADPALKVRFVSNIDPIALWQATHDLDPAETLFVICSKTFTTLETLTNARKAREWLLNGLGAPNEAVARHFIAVSTNEKEVERFGIDVSTMLEFWDWVGGRYSVDSAIGFSLMIAIGKEAFTDFLAGFRSIDEHFRTAPLSKNMPVIQGMLNVWYNNFHGAQTHAVLPYSERMARFPAYLQQLTMESNGKSVRLDGTSVGIQTGEIFWGEPGTNGQHAFYQLLHQGTKLIPADIILFSEPVRDIGDEHDALFANGLAQAAALSLGKNASEVAAEGVSKAIVPHKVMPGNRPVTVVVAKKLTPAVLGQLIAFYEHTVFVEGCIWGIDSFDQWGVELGKAMAARLTPLLAKDRVASQGRESEVDAATSRLIDLYRNQRGR
ncbi:MAG: glucose-6-phosphate isomerase [Actinobacteria bacterium]|nr:glucose-6-phosphate isomerase [Actinomycetota bacterium]